MPSTSPEPAAAPGGCLAAWCGWSACGLVLALWLARWPSFPLMLDPAYHLLTAQQMRAAGGVIATDLWQFAPVGRPHLYPPVTHLIVAGLLQAGVPPLTAMRLMTVALVPAAIVSLGLAARRLLGSEPALGVWLMTLVPFWWWLHLAMAWAAAVGLVLLLWWAVAVVDGKGWAAAGLATLLWYTHLGLPWVLVLSAAVFGAISRPHRAVAWTSAVVGAILALPWLWHLAAHRGVLRVVPRLENQSLDVAPALIGWAVAGVWAAWRAGGRARMAVALMLGAIPLIWRFPYRGWSGEGLAPMLVLAGHGLAWGSRSAAARFGGRAPRAAVLAVLVGLTWLTPALSIGDGRPSWRWPEGVPWHLFNAPGVAPSPLDRSAYGRQVEAIVRQVEAASAPGQIVWSNAAYAGGLVAALAGRAVSSGMLYEIPAAAAFDPLAAAHLVLWWRIAPLPGMPALEAVRRRYPLQPVMATDAAMLFRQPQATATAATPRAVVPMALAAVLICGLLIIVMYDLARARPIARRTVDG